MIRTRHVLLLLVAPFMALSVAGFTGANAGSAPHQTTPTHSTLSAHRLWVASINPNADSVPAYLPHVKVRGSKVSVLYLLAGNNTSDCNPGDPVRTATLYALNAASGKQIWTRSTSGPSRCTTAAPVADPSGAWVYAAGLDGKVHKYDAATGKEAVGHGWPATITLMPDVEKVSANLTIGNGRLYVTTSGFIGDQGHYQGHLVSIDLKTGRANVFNSLCSNVRQLLGPAPGKPNYCPDVQSGFFGRGEGVVDPVSHDVYVVSGNGPWNGRTNWGDTIMKLDPSGSRLLDAYTPTNQESLANSDNDLGSTGPALLPPIKSGGHTYHLLVQGGKGPACDGCNGTALRLLNRDNLSGQAGPGHLGGDLATAQAPGGCEVLTAPIVRKSGGKIWVVYASSCGVAGYTVSGPSKGKFTLLRRWSVGRGGTTPALNHGVLYVAHDGGITALDPANGATLGSISGIGGVHWEYPLVAGNRAFMTDENGHVFAWGIK